MQISYNWLKQFLNIDWDAQKTGELLTDLGLEVEGITPFESVKGGLRGIVVGEILTCVPHPNADRLKLTTVNVGNGKSIQIVCGAPNVAAGQKVAVATVGTTLYDDKGEAWTIKKGKIRGAVSNGMICAEDEMGLGKGHEGILVLSEELVPGTLLSEIYGIEKDEVFEIGLTPNRADAMSHMGVARDLRAGLMQLKQSTEFITPSISAFHVENRTQRIDVVVEDETGAPRYCGVTLSGLTVQDSPAWLKNRLKAIGLTPKNNVVDVTNYVLHELGQPLHAFDMSGITGNEIHVKRLPTGTRFTTLDEVERCLHSEDLMICDAEKPLCIAGVFGGSHGAVTTKTTSIFLESAYFDPISIRKTAKRHGLNTDASFRFERGIDPNMAKYALKRAVLLVQEVAGGIVTSELVDIYQKKIEDHQVVLHYKNAHRLLGEKIPADTIKSILSSLDIKINNATETGIGMTIPAYRNDVTREVDVIEEILRVYGYNNIAFQDKWNISVAGTSVNDDYKVQKTVGDQLAALGFYEIMTNSLTSPTYAELTTDLHPEENVTMLNPLSRDLMAMRQSLLFSGLEAIAHNLNRKAGDLRLFEFGTTYRSLPNEREERKILSLLVTGNRNGESWLAGQQESMGFFYLKGVMTALMNRLGISDLEEIPTEEDIFSEGISFHREHTILASMGVLNQKILDHFEIDQEVVYAKFHWEAVLAKLYSKDAKFQPIPKFPSSRRDFALLLDDSIDFDQIKQITENTEKKSLQSVTLFDVYTGKNLPPGKKSYGVSFIFRDDHKTLTDKQVDRIMQKLEDRFEKELGATLR